MFFSALKLSFFNTTVNEASFPFAASLKRMVEELQFLAPEFAVWEPRTFGRTDTKCSCSTKNQQDFSTDFLKTSSDAETCSWSHFKSLNTIARSKLLQGLKTLLIPREKCSLVRFTLTKLHQNHRSYITYGFTWYTSLSSWCDRLLMNAQVERFESIFIEWQHYWSIHSESTFTCLNRLFVQKHVKVPVPPPPIPVIHIFLCRSHLHIVALQPWQSWIQCKSHEVTAFHKAVRQEGGQSLLSL